MQFGRGWPITPAVWSRVFSGALCARAEGKAGVLVPADNAAEAAVVEGLQVIPIQNLREAVSFLEGEIQIAPTRVNLANIFDQPHKDGLDFSEVKGQESVKRARAGDRGGGRPQRAVHRRI